MMLAEKILQKDKSVFSPPKEVNIYKQIVELCEVSLAANPVKYLNFSNQFIGQLIVRNECEDAADYKSRLARTPVRPYLAQILNKYLGAAFRNWPSFASDSVDQQQVMRLAKDLFSSLFISGSFVAAVDEENVTVFDMKQLVNVEEESRTYIFAEETEEYTIVAPGLLLRVDGNFDEIATGEVSIIDYFSVSPFALNLAVQQRALHNLLSLLQEEITNSVFTKYILSGVNLQPQDERQKISWSGKRLMVIPDAAAKLETIGSDAKMSEILMQAIDAAEKQLYESAGIVQMRSTGSNLSGISLQLLREDFYSNINNFIDIIEDKINSVFPGVSFSRKFELDDELSILTKVKEIWASNLPESFKRFVLENYLQKFTNLDDEQISTLIGG